ncbi:MAG: hypothetical protein V3T90_03210 [Anaerolineae bacterium]
MSNGSLQVGRVLRAGTRGFVIGCAVMQPDIPAFGSFVRTEGQTPGSAIYGLIYDVSVEDDPFVRQLISAELRNKEVELDDRENRRVPVEVSVLAVGCNDGDTIRHRLPAQPPVTLDWLYQCSDEDVRAFTDRFDYFRLVLEARELPADELLAASLRAAAAARPEGERETFLVEAGRELARLLAGDPVRLEGLLRRLREGAR